MRILLLLVIAMAIGCKNQEQTEAIEKAKEAAEAVSKQAEETMKQAEAAVGAAMEEAEAAVGSAMQEAGAAIEGAEITEEATEESMGTIHEEGSKTE